MKQSVSPSHTITLGQLSLSSLKPQSKLRCSNNYSVLVVTPTALSHPNTQQVLPQFDASDHRSSGSSRGRVSRVVTAIS